MFKKESIRNYIVRFLCAILLLMVQMDVLACDVCEVSLCSEIEWVQTDAGEMQGEVCVDDYYRQLPRPSVAKSFLHSSERRSYFPYLLSHPSRRT